MPPVLGRGAGRPLQAQASPIGGAGMIRTAAALPVLRASGAPRATGRPTSCHELVAADVEYAHFVHHQTEKKLAFAAEVCLVDQEGNTIFHSYCRPTRKQLRQMCWQGGVPLTAILSAPTIQDVSKQAASYLTGVDVVGMSIGGDLHHLGLCIPRKHIKDLVHVTKFRRMSRWRNSAPGLKVLVQRFLGRTIQARRPHCPKEDAHAAMELYLKVVLKR